MRSQDSAHANSGPDRDRLEFSAVAKEAGGDDTGHVKDKDHYPISKHHVCESGPVIVKVVRRSTVDIIRDVLNWGRNDGTNKDQNHQDP